MSWFGNGNVTGLVALVVVAASIACGSPPTTATGPSAVTYTEIFTGSLTKGGTDYGPPDSPHHFTVHQPGNIDAILTDIEPSSITLGLGFGIWDSTAQACTLQLSSNEATLNKDLSATVGTPGEWCVGIFDVGNISASDTYTYTVTITHT